MPGRKVTTLFKLTSLTLFTLVLVSCARPPTQLTGIIVYGHEVRTVRLCGDAQTFWLHLTQEQQQQLAAKSRNLTTYPYQELYLEFIGSKMSYAPGEFAKAYAGSIKVEQIWHVSVVIPNSCSRLRIVP